MADGKLLAEIRQVLADSPFVGEGHRKVWARLRRRGVRTSRKRVLRLTREAGLLAPTARVRKRSQRLHEGTIIVEVPDTLWATDATEAWSGEGRAAVFAVVDHASGEAWTDAARRMDRFAAADLREGMEETLTLTRLGITGSLKRTLESTNPCESMIECVRRTSRNVKRWSSGDMALRWTAAGTLEAERQFRRIVGYRDLAKLCVAIERDIVRDSITAPTAGGGALAKA